MFQSSANRVRAWLLRFEDILGDPPECEPPHPHRRPLRWQPLRRDGSVPARPMHCISPVPARTSSTATERDPASR